MRELATRIRDNQSQIADTVERSLRAAEITAQEGRTIATRLVESVAAGLETGEQSTLTQSLQAALGEIAAREDLKLDDVQLTTVALGEAIDAIQASPHVWTAIAKAQVTLAQMATEKARAAETQFYALADNIAVGIFIHQNGIIQYIGSEGTRLMGYDQPDELVGRPILDFVPAAERERIADIARRRALGEDVASRYATQLVRHDGSIVDVLMQSMIIEYEGEPATQGAFIDITEQQRATEQITRSQETLQMLVDNLPFGVAIIGKDKHVRRVNQAALSMMEYGAEDEIVGRICHDTLCPAEENQCPIIDFGQEVDKSERILLTKDGTAIPILKSVVPVFIDGEEALMEAFIDITAQQEAEQRIRASLERRERQVQTSTEIAQEIAAATDLDDLFQRVVTLIKERFNYYHAQIFRYDPQEDAMVLVVSYGEAGEQLLAAGHRLETGRGVVGTAAIKAQPVLASDVTQEPDWIPNIHLPHTRGELAVPIILRGQTLGILDVQSNVAGALDEEDQLLLEGLCGQIAIAIESIQLLEETRVFRQFAEASEQGFAIASLEGQITYANPTLHRTLGQDRITGLPLWSLYQEETRDRVKNDLLPTVRRGGSWMGELNVVSKRGRLLPTIQNIFLIQDENGTPIYLACAITDISDRKRAERAIEESETKHRTLLNSIQSPILALRRDLTILYCNRAYADFAQQPIAALEGHNLLDVLPEFVQTQSFEAFTKAFESGTGTAHEAEDRMDNRYVHTQVYPTPWGALGIAEDITKRKTVETNMQEAMQELENLYRVMSREGWEAFREETGAQAYLYDGTEVKSTDDLWLPQMEEAVERGTLATPMPDDSQSVATVPLQVYGETIGVMGIEVDLDNPMSEEEFGLISSAAEQIAQALETSRLFRETQIALAQTDTLYAGSDRVIRATSHEEVIQALVESTALQRVDHVSLLLFDTPWLDELPPGLTISATWERSGQSAPAPAGTYYRMGEYPVAELLQQHEPMVIRDGAVDERIDERARQALVDRAGARCLFILPISVGQQSIGTIVGQAQQPLAFSDEEIRQITTLSDQADIVIQGQILFEQTQAALEQIQATHRLYVRQEWADYAPTRISPIHERTQPEVIPLAEAILSREFEELNQAIAQVMTQPEQRARAFEEDDRTAVVVPIDLHGEVIGMLGLHDEEGRRWTEEEIALIEAVANQMGLAMENARLLEATRSRANRDRLIADITTRVRASMDPESILRAAVRELGVALGTDRAFIQVAELPDASRADAERTLSQEVDR
jgi:PAS domain S-box-containing protein